MSDLPWNDMSVFMAAATHINPGLHAAVGQKVSNS